MKSPDNGNNRLSRISDCTLPLGHWWHAAYKSVEQAGVGNIAMKIAMWSGHEIIDSDDVCFWGAG